MRLYTTLDLQVSNGVMTRAYEACGLCRKRDRIMLQVFAELHGWHSHNRISFAITHQSTRSGPRPATGRAEPSESRPVSEELAQDGREQICETASEGPI